MFRESRDILTFLFHRTCPQCVLTVCSHIVTLSTVVTCAAAMSPLVQDGDRLTTWKMVEIVRLEKTLVESLEDKVYY